MKRRNALLPIIALAVGLTFAPLPTRAGAQINYVIVLEKALRKNALRTVMPSFPEESRRRGSKGVAVAQLYIDADGNVTRAEILEAPDPLIGQAVTDAVMQWKFRPAHFNNQATPLRGKLTFYYVNEDGRARVENPRQFQ